LSLSVLGLGPGGHNVEVQRIYTVQDMGKFRCILGYCGLRSPDGSIGCGTGVVHYGMNSNIRDQMPRRNRMFTRNSLRNILFGLISRESLFQLEIRDVA
jgi:hypothetical protein